MDEELLTAARAARERAYAPYSGFRVGAAVRDKSGGVHIGCNVENAAYPEGTCAEAGAIAAMVAAGETRLSAVLIVAQGAEPVTPCGGCRQKMVEFGTGDVPVFMVTLDGAARMATLASLLPGAFCADHVCPSGD